MNRDFRKFFRYNVQSIWNGIRTNTYFPPRITRKQFLMVLKKEVEWFNGLASNYLA